MQSTWKESIPRTLSLLLNLVSKLQAFLTPVESVVNTLAMTRISVSTWGTNTLSRNPAKVILGHFLTSFSVTSVLLNVMAFSISGYFPITGRLIMTKKLGFKESLSQVMLLQTLLNLLRHQTTFSGGRYPVISVQKLWRAKRVWSNTRWSSMTLRSLLILVISVSNPMHPWISFYFIEGISIVSRERLPRIFLRSSVSTVAVDSRTNRTWRNTWTFIIERSILVKFVAKSLPLHHPSSNTSIASMRRLCVFSVSSVVGDFGKKYTWPITRRSFIRMEFIILTFSRRMTRSTGLRLYTTGLKPSRGTRLPKRSTFQVMMNKTINTLTSCTKSMTTAMSREERSSRIKCLSLMLLITLTRLSLSMELTINSSCKKNLGMDMIMQTILLLMPWTALGQIAFLQILFLLILEMHVQQTSLVFQSILIQ